MSDAEKFVFYRYTVSVAAASIFIALFLVTSLYHVVQLIQTKRWNMVPLVIGGFMQVGGYAARIKGNHDPWNLPGYIAQSLLLLVAPVLFAATIYMTLAGIIVTAVARNIAIDRAKTRTSTLDEDDITLAGIAAGSNCTSTVSSTELNNSKAEDIVVEPSHLAAAMQTTVLKIPVVWITRIFVTADIVALMTQGGGGGMMSGGGKSKMEMGEKIVLAGLWIQIIAFLFFISVGVVFDRQERIVAKLKGEEKRGAWGRMMWVLYAVSGLILVRNLFRVIEYAQGNDGYLMRNEVWLYLFDALLMWVLMVLLNWCHPGKVLMVEGAGTNGEMEMEEGRGRKGQTMELDEMNRRG
ncbi:hypothetical protein EX30DRAFT_364250 [Ascodesmis nigricans]|uniref:RTA1-domain-containing protein n=1 Tax=Ascodesmis nigricans TaxID=341454 RepID=A0A4S2MWI1_9PEZI|nr:hypothetical protein EX30DRAFT_364250 [Ascodesmis nigricans]